MTCTPQRWRMVNEAVYYTDGPVTGLDESAVRHLVGLVASTPRQRVRVCAHQDPDSSLHEMMIVLGADGYVQPHRHHGKQESLHVIEGQARLVLFDDQGEITEQIRLGPFGSDACWYYRIGEPVFHTVIPETATFAFHETTLGPFQREDTETAAWAPNEGPVESWSEYHNELKRKLGMS